VLPKALEKFDQHTPFLSAQRFQAGRNQQLQHESICSVPAKEAINCNKSASLPALPASSSVILLTASSRAALVS
jgi:hypothetical protein